MSPTFLLALCTLIQQASPPKVETLRGAHFQVTAHFDARKLAEEALSAAEAVVPHVEPVFGKVAIERKGAVITGELMPIHLYWGKFDLGSEPPAPTALAREFAFTSDATHAAYVLITPNSVGNALGSTGLPLHTKLDVARVAAQLWARRASPLAPAWPYWFIDGGTTWAAEEGCRARTWIQTRLEYPACATETLHAQDMLRTKSLPDVFSFVDSIPGGLTAIERQCVSSQWFRFLKEPANAKVLDSVAYAARATKQDDVPAAMSRVMRSVVGDEKAQGALDIAFQTWLTAQRPAWQELHGSLWPVGDTWIQAAHDVNAISWRADVTADERYELSGEVVFLPAEHRQANLLLARGEHTFVQVAFVADHGVDVSQFDTQRSENERWKKLTTGELSTLNEGRFIPFRIVAQKAALEVWIDEKPVLAIPDTGAPLTGAWGLGAFAGSCVAWRNLVFKALP